MPALFVFLLKVNIALLLFCAGYYLVLRHLTFYTLNRIYLVAAILFATIYPKINLDNFAQNHQQLTNPVQVVILNFKAPAEALVKPLTQPGYWYWFEAAFWLGASVLAVRLFMQLFSLYKLHRNSIPLNIRDHKIRVIHGDAAPFSFWRSIYVNPANHEAADLKAILQHEQVHVNEWHTLDIILAELSTIFYWFNPGVWLMKRAVRENIEFITDQKILNNGADSKQYQYSLVNVSFSAAPQNIVNHFNLSTIKKRIIMMNTKRSSKFNLTRYAFLVPAVVICLLTFSFSKAELIKKSNIAYKAITKSAAKIDIINTVDHGVSKMGASIVNFIQSNDTIKAAKNTASDFTVYTISDTTKKRLHDTVRRIRTTMNYSYTILDSSTRPRIVINGVKTGDEPIIVVDGRVVKNEDINKMSAAKIGSINVEKDARDGKSVIYITSNNTPRVVSGVRINGVTAKRVNGSYMVVDTVKIVNGKLKLDTVYLSNNNPVIVRGMSGETINGSMVYTTTVPDDKRKVLLNKMRGLIVTSNGTVIKTDSVKLGNSIKKFNTFAYTISGRNHENNINNLSNKLIFIDGKEATARDMKKLSAANIESMSSQSGDEVIKKYGDKAKDGVLFITTKKAK